MTKQDEIVAFIAAYYREHSYPPSVRDIGTAVGLSSTSTVHHHLSALQREGRITHDPKIPRSILVVTR
jgi:repressor LexA